MSLLIALIRSFFTAYSLIILVRLFGSWFSSFARSRLMQITYQLTEPYLKFFRRFIPPVGGTLDISPVVALIVLRFVEQVLLFLLIR